MQRSSMHSSKPRGSPYHHGNLRQTLLNAGLELVTEKGTNGFTLREVARRAGVSHNAPYAHFRDRADLVAALAAQGLRGLRDALAEARDRTTGNAIDRLRSTGVAYVQFAIQNPAAFRLIMRPELRQTPPETGGGQEVDRLAEEALGVLSGALHEVAERGEISPDGLEANVLVCWSAVHGLAVLVLDRMLQQAQDQEVDAIALAERLTDMIARGLLSTRAEDEKSGQ
ncbi:MAG: TetR/AcrR family transcriptional regulator [Isosphaeraceae bacterium]